MGDGSTKPPIAPGLFAYDNYHGGAALSLYKSSKRGSEDYGYPTCPRPEAQVCNIPTCRLDIYTHLTSTCPSDINAQLLLSDDVQVIRNCTVGIGSISIWEQLDTTKEITYYVPSLSTLTLVKFSEMGGAGPKTIY